MATGRGVGEAHGSRETGPIVSVAGSGDEAATLVRLEGVVAASDVDRVVERVEALRDRSEVILDLTDATLVDPEGARDLGQSVARLDGDVRLVCRLSARRLLRRTAGIEVPVFATLEDALGPGSLEPRSLAPGSLAPAAMEPDDPPRRPAA